MCLHYPNMYILCKWVIGSKSAWQTWKFKCHCYSLLAVSQGKQQFVVMLIFPWFWCEQCKEELASLSSFWEADSCSSHDKLFLQRKSNHCRTYMLWIIHKHWSLDLDRSVWEQFPGCCMFADYCHLATHVPVSSAGFGCQCHQMKKHRICLCSIMVLCNSDFCCSVLQVNKLVGETYQQKTFLHGQSH
jgi:hypothetical protein